MKNLTDELKSENYKKANGTSLVLTIENLSFETLINTLDIPKKSEDEKVQCEWMIEVEGEIILIYDWKENKKFNKVTEWNISANNSNHKKIAKLVKKVLGIKLTLKSESSPLRTIYSVK